MVTDNLIDPSGRPGDIATVADRDLINPTIEDKSILPGVEAGKSVKDVPESTIGQSVQELPKQVGATPGTTSFQDTLIWFTGHAADEFEAWGQRHGKRRDKQLRDFIATESMFASALGIVIVRNSAFNWEVSGDPQTADVTHQILIEANMGLGWEDFIAKISADLYTQDSGAFIEVVRDGSDPESPLVGINHLDAARCWHTGDPTKPVIYQDVKSKYHLLDWWNVVTLAEMPTAIEGLYGMQFCAETRLMMAAQIMKNIAIYKAEKSGGRNTRAIQLIQGLTTEQVNDAIADLRNRADAQGFMRYMQPVIIGSHDPQATLDVKTLELVSLPDGFDEDEAFRHYIAMIAMAFGSDYQEFAPLPGGNLGTSMQSEILHAKNRGKGPGMFMKLIRNALNQRILPRNVKFEYSEMDLQAEELQAEISKTRAETRKIQLESFEINQAEARQIAVDAGDLPQPLFDASPGGDITPVDTVVPQGEPHHAKGELEVSPSSNPFGLATTDAGTRQKTEPVPPRAGPFDDDRVVAEGRLRRALQRAFKKHFTAVKKRLRLEQREERRLGIRSISNKALGDLVDDIEFWGLRKEEFMAEVGDQPMTLLLEGGEQAQALGLVVDMSLVNNDALRFNREFSNRWWSELSTQTRDGLRTAIATHIETGGPLRTLNKNLEPLFGKARAEMIARTEVTRMYAEGNRIAYAKAGITVVEWRTVKDAVVDPICDDLDEQRMTLGQESIVPPAHPRCRCWLAPVVDGKTVAEPVPPGGTTPTSDGLVGESKLGTTGAGDVAGGIHSGSTSIGNLPPGVLPESNVFHETRMLHKRVQGEVSREVNAYKTFEIVEPGWAPTVYADTDGAGHMMRWVDDAGFGGKADLVGGFRSLSAAEARDYGRMSVVDGIIGNTDRHGANALRYRDRLYPIDNGYARGISRRRPGIQADTVREQHFSLWSPEVQDAYLDGLTFARDRIVENLDDVTAIWFDSLAGPIVEAGVQRFPRLTFDQMKSVFQEAIDFIDDLIVNLRRARAPLGEAAPGLSISQLEDLDIEAALAQLGLV